jgi:dimethylamine/trimethylamine dehydrogenase
MAAMRGMKAEGGWAVVCTEQCDIHPSSNVTKEIRLWDEQDIPYLARITEMIHAHSNLAGIELVHSGHRTGNLKSRDIPIAPSVCPVVGFLPITARTLSVPPAPSPSVSPSTNSSAPPVFVPARRARTSSHY